MAAITDLSDYINLQTGGGNGNPTGFLYQKNGRINGANGITGAAQYVSQWLEDGIPCPGAIPSSAAIPDNTTTGAIPLSAPGGSRQKWLIGFAANARRGGLVVLYDRLMHCGGLSGTSTSSQTVSSPTLTRNTGGIGNLIMTEVYTTVGTTNVDVTITYTDENSNTSTTYSNLGGGAAGAGAPGACVICPTADGDLGVKTITSVQLSATTGTAGNWGISIIRPIALVSLPLSGSSASRDYISGLPIVPELSGSECLAVYSVCPNNNVRDLRVWINTVEK